MTRRLTDKRHPSVPAGQALDRNLVPLINVVFLMLIFFLLVGTIRTPDPIDIKPPESTSETLPSVHSILILVGSNGDVWINGQPTSIIELPAQLKSLWPERPAPIGGGVQMIEIRADRRVRFNLLRQILHLANNAGSARIKLVTQR